MLVHTLTSHSVWDKAAGVGNASYSSQLLLDGSGYVIGFATVCLSLQEPVSGT